MLEGLAASSAVAEFDKLKFTVLAIGK